MEIDFHNLIDCQAQKCCKTGKTRAQFMNYTTPFACISLPPLSMLFLTAFNCIQVKGEWFEDLRMSSPWAEAREETPQATRPAPISAEFMQLKTCFNCRNAATMEP